MMISRSNMLHRRNMPFDCITSSLFPIPFLEKPKSGIPPKTNPLRQRSIWAPSNFITVQFQTRVTHPTLRRTPTNCATQRKFDQPRASTFLGCLCVVQGLSDTCVAPFGRIRFALVLGKSQKLKLKSWIDLWGLAQLVSRFSRLCFVSHRRLDQTGSSRSDAVESDLQCRVATKLVLFATVNTNLHGFGE